VTSNSEEVHRGNRFPVIAEKGKPALGRLRISSAASSNEDRSLRDIKTEHEKLAMNALALPTLVLNNHPEDQFLNLLRCLSSPCGLPTLEISFQYKRNPALCQRTTVSGRDRNEDCCHPGPESTNGDPEELVEQSSLGRGCRRFRTASC